MHHALDGDSLFLNYAANARPYSLLMACIAFALVCYDRLPSFGWAILFGLSLAMAQGVYYFAILRSYRLP